MGQGNVEVVRRQVDAFNRRDADAFVADTHPDVVFDPQRSAIEGTYRGHDGIRRYFNDTLANFEVFRVEYELEDVDGDRVLMIGTAHFRSMDPVLESDFPTAAIATYRDGLLIGWVDYGDPEKARAAAGITRGAPAGSS